MEHKEHNTDSCPRCTAWRNLPKDLPFDDCYRPPTCFTIELLRILSTNEEKND